MIVDEDTGTAEFPLTWIAGKYDDEYVTYVGKHRGGGQASGSRAPGRHMERRAIARVLGRVR